MKLLQTSSKVQIPSAIAKQRLFIAIGYRPTTDVVQLRRHLQELANEPITRLRVSAENNLHITLKFLGMVPETDITAIVQKMDKLGPTCKSFDIDIEGIGCFSNSIWLGVEESETLRNLATKLDKELADFGFTVEPKSFIPHITVARIGGNRNIKSSQLQQQYGSTRWGKLTVTEFHLYQSNTLPSGATYSILHTTGLSA